MTDPIAKYCKDEKWAVEAHLKGNLWMHIQFCHTRTAAEGVVRTLKRIHPASLTTSKPRRYRVSKWIRVIPDFV